MLFATTAVMLSRAVGIAAFVDHVLVFGLYAYTVFVTGLPLLEPLPPMTYKTLFTTAATAPPMGAGRGTPVLQTLVAG